MDVRTWDSSDGRRRDRFVGFGMVGRTGIDDWEHKTRKSLLRHGLIVHGLEVHYVGVHTLPSPIDSRMPSASSLEQPHPEWLEAVLNVVIVRYQLDVKSV